MSGPASSASPSLGGHLKSGQRHPTRTRVFITRRRPFRQTERSPGSNRTDRIDDDNRKAPGHIAARVCAERGYLSVFPEATKVGELRSSGVGPWPAGKIATITIELMGLQMTFLNGGPAHALTPAFSYSVACKDQAEIDRYWDKLLEGGKAMACGWLTDKFGLCWQIVPERISEILKHPNAMAAMMKMVKFDIATLEAARKE